MLRLREEETVYLTFKGPRQQSEYKKREELQLEFPDVSSARSLLHAIGFTQWFYYEKVREKWVHDTVEIVLDELPGLGLFVEVEAPSDKEIEAMRKRLKLPRDYVNSSYVELLQEHGRQTTQGKKRFQFPEDYQSALDKTRNAG